MTWTHKGMANMHVQIQHKTHFEVARQARKEVFGVVPTMTAEYRIFFFFLGGGGGGGLPGMTQLTKKSPIALRI